MGRKRDDFWQYVDKENKCIYCRHQIPGASRIKFHLAKVPGGGIQECEKVPDEVQCAAALALNSSNNRVKQSRTPNDLDENNIDSNLSRASTRGKCITGRKRDDFWQYVDKENMCIYCGHKIPGASRIKFHLAKVPGGGIQECKKVPDEVQCAAALALNSSNKRVKQSKTPNDLDENNTNSNLSRASTRGKIEVDLLPTTDLVGEEFETHLDEIWDWLMEDDEMSIMGVWGMGGVGKTALLKHIHNKLVNHKHHVIWVTVTQNYDIGQVQRAIAMSIDENILKSGTEVKIAAQLSHAFKKMNKCVVILDDVWYDISLEDVGIPLMNNGIRIIVASRLLDVCKTIGCKENIIQVDLLHEDEDFTLFLKSLGDDVTLPDDISDIARELTSECQGLPLAIVTIARSMRGKADIREWRNALSKLQNPNVDHDDIKQCVFPKLKSSFDRLNDRTLQDFFLCLALCYDESSPMLLSKEILVRKFVHEGLINGRQDFEAQLDEGHSILNKLTNNSLLIELEIGNCISLHRLVWAVALNIGKESHGYMYKTELPDEQELEEDLQKIILSIDEITEIPAISHTCPKLSTFCIHYNSCLKVISNDFFTYMPALKMLDLSYNMSIKVLPVSISNLECLTVLLLASCELLRHIPSLAKLRQLRKLDLSDTAITEAPIGFENLDNLKWLSLDGTVVMKAQYLERLKMLESITATFVDDKDEFNACVQIVNARINSRLMRGYFLHLQEGAKGVISNCDILDKIGSHKTVMVKSVEHSTLMLPTVIDVLQIEGCNQWKSLCDVFTIQQSNNKLHISTCKVTSSDELEYLFCSSDDCILCSSPRVLNKLYLYELNSLSMLCKENEVASSFLPFSHLTELSIWRCKGMKKLITPRMSTQLQNLVVIKVQYCESMEEIFSTGRSTNFHDCCYSYDLWSLLDTEANEVDINVEPINLPNLKSVSLMYLPQLISVCEVFIVCGSLKEFSIVDCPKLKCIPQTQPPFEIQVKDRLDEEFS